MRFCQRLPAGVVLGLGDRLLNPPGKPSLVALPRVSPHPVRSPPPHPGRLGSDTGCPWRTLLAAVSLSGLPLVALTHPLRGMAMGQTRRKFGAVSGRARSGWSVMPEAIAQLAAPASTQ